MIELKEPASDPSQFLHPNNSLSKPAKKTSESDALKKLLAKKSVEYPSIHPLTQLFKPEHVFQLILTELNPTLMHRYSEVQTLLELSVLMEEINRKKTHMKQEVRVYKAGMNKTGTPIPEQKFSYNMHILDIEFKMRMVDLLEQRDKLLSN